MSYAPSSRPNPKRRDMVKRFVRARGKPPIQGIAGKRPPLTARLRTGLTARGLGDADRRGDQELDYEYVVASDGGIGASPAKVLKKKRARVGAFGLKKHVVDLEALDPTEDYEAAYAYNSGEAGLGNWFTDAVSRPFEAIGLTSPDDPTPVKYIAWRAAVMARGHTVGRMPSGAQAGEWAEIAVVNGKRVYAIAPPDVIAEDANIASIIQRQRAAGSAATTSTNILNALKPTNLASSITGIPSWMFPVLLVGGGYLVLKSVLPPQRSA